MVQTVGSKQTVTLLQEVLASHDLDQDLEAGEHSPVSGRDSREAEVIGAVATPTLPSASPSATPPFAGYGYNLNYLSDSTAELADFRNVETHHRFGEIWCPQSSIIENYQSNTIAPASLHLQTSSLDYHSSARTLESSIPEYY